MTTTFAYTNPSGQLVYMGVNGQSPSWSGSNSYEVGYAVFYNNRTWVANAPNTSITPATGAGSPWTLAVVFKTGNLNSLSGSVVLPANVDSYQLVNAGWNQAPDDVLLSIRKSALGKLNLQPTLAGPPTADGFLCSLGGITDDDTYVLRWVAVVD